MRGELLRWTERHLVKEAAVGHGKWILDGYYRRALRRVVDDTHRGNRDRIDGRHGGRGGVQARGRDRPNAGITTGGIVHLPRNSLIGGAADRRLKLQGRRG